ncbi:predicted protein [Sclerotinia sclerotiorum 1980 UF-70]|uniref:Mid2 domain-containing protein n=2 Tax=Sclerotinia sclerotiorum (strain ATCC 18683 / 1980 / Ss-1) TaxID=665079 RepID=A0A1D9Q1G0_SCLS1|nr:predicted protein [Sclerotinia sclerotiorum 1980 UF-70]APA08764.1 hypothetical protein sscle_04g035340 [Sclerotinia sclerotiorum 1980 UF-70]EDN99684.1 predicted protein [Sclerotinia sclerotiorum 1980 UF-70]
MHHLAISFGLLCWLTGLVRAQCYSYMGVEMDSTYIACNGSVPVSMCCRLGVPDNNGGDVCGSGSTYGLCGITGSQLWRESCTDKTWQSPLCLKLCVGVNDTEITACSDGSYCCGRNAEECCTEKKGKFIVNNQVSDTAAADSSSTQTSQPTSASLAPISIHASEFGSSSTFAATLSILVQSNGIQTSVMITTVYQPLPTSTSQYTSRNNRQLLSTSVKAGIAVGATAGIVSLLALALFFWKRAPTKSKLQGLPATEINPSSLDLDSRPTYVYRAEVDGTMPKRVEVHGCERRREPAEML